MGRHLPSGWRDDAPMRREGGREVGGEVGGYNRGRIMGENPRESRGVGGTTLCEERLRSAADRLRPEPTCGREGS